LLVWAITLPLTIYEDIFASTAVDFHNQDLAQWLRDQIVGVGLAVMLGGFHESSGL
jgi:hypothetical protein